MINVEEILDNIYESTINALTDGYDTEKILLTQEVYDAFKKEQGNKDFNELLVYPVEINNNIDRYMVVVKEIGE